MKKKVILLVFALGINAMAFSQQVTKNDAIEAAKAKQNEFLANLKTIEGIKEVVSKFKVNDKKGSNQFWIEQGKTFRYGARKRTVIKSTDDFSTVAKIINNKKKLFTIEKFSNDAPVISKATPHRGTGLIEYYTIEFSIRNCHTKLSCSYLDKEKKTVTNSSDACYDLTMTWTVKLKLDKKKKISEIEKIEIESIQATPNNDKELLGNLNKEMNRLINEWYTDSLPVYFTNNLQGDEFLYHQMSPTQVTNQNITKLPQDKVVTISNNLPIVQIYVNPNKYMSSDSMYVNNPTAFYTFRPESFVITFSDDYKQGKLSVKFDNGTLTEPQTLSVQERKKRETIGMINQTKDNLFSIIENFVNKPNAENAKLFKSMFTENGTVEIAYLTPNGVKKEIRDYSKYVNNLRGINVEIEQINEPTIDFATDPWTATITYTQRTSYFRYCDRTNKRIYFVLDENGSFKITNIVVENDPVPCE